MLVAALFLVLLNGFFVLSEFAIVKVRRSKLEEMAKHGKPNASLALKMSNSLDTYLSATQLGITLSSLALGWIGEPALARLIEPTFNHFFGDNPVLLHTVSFAIAFTVITFLHVVFGELVPKSVAIAKAETMALIIARPLYLFWILFYPLIRFFDIVAAFFLKRIGIAPSSEHEMAHSEEEIRIIVNESFKGGYIDSVESEIIKNAVDFSETVAKEIYRALKPHFPVFYDEKSAVGRRYRRQDEAGTPYCITVDGQTLQDRTVTIRDRDTLEQWRVKVDDCLDELRQRLR